jgi:nucleoside-diphosphate-sugar epimerase
MIKHKRILITGGAGLIGCGIIDKLIEDNIIIIFDNFFKNILQYNKNKKHKNLTII